jgi:hypothetical protein
MDIYNLGNVDSTIDGVIGPLLYGFNIIGIHGHAEVRSALQWLGRRWSLRPRAASRPFRAALDLDGTLGASKNLPFPA